MAAAGDETAKGRKLATSFFWGGGGSQVQLCSSMLQLGSNAIEECLNGGSCYFNLNHVRFRKYNFLSYVSYIAKDWGSS